MAAFAYVTIAVVGGSLSACRTHEGAPCLAACTTEDEAAFADCVANGGPGITSTGPCEAGNRRCCALAQECAGNLDDQTVTSDLTACDTMIMVDVCGPACTLQNETTFDACLTDGGRTCTAGDHVCCATQEACLGSLSGYTVVNAACCMTTDDCPVDHVCDPMTYTCEPTGTQDVCGDGTKGTTEECDDGNTVTERCAYDIQTCTVCDASCHSAQATGPYCGDGVVDHADGEECEPEDLYCDSACQPLVPLTCLDGARDGTETDVDCGGRECPACVNLGLCQVPSDCRVLYPDCSGTVDCAPTLGYCEELTFCNDDNPCTDDVCDASGGCTNVTIDRDMDGHGPLVCGADCNDRDPTIYPGAAEICADSIDQDCDELIDEGCP